MSDRAPFPHDPETFDQDSRISYSKQSRSFVLEDEQGEEWEWLSGPAKWSKSMDEQLVQQQAEIYKVAGVDDQEPALNPAKKRKEAQLEDPDTNPKSAKSSAKNNSNTNPTPRENTAVFVSGLPQDVDSEEIRAAFSKYGVIAESVDNNQKRIKLYNDKDGNFKGEALIIYHRAESVGQAVYLADGMLFPRLQYDASSSTIKVVPADSNFKAHKDDTVAEDRPRPKARTAADKAKGKKKAEEMNRLLADWSDDEPSAVQQTSSRWDKVVIIKNVFTFKELEEDPEFIQDATEDMTEGAEPHGTIKNITFFDKEEDGVVTIRFSDAMSAKACASAFDGRMYAGRALEASIATGEEKFKKTRKIRNTEEDEAKRLEEYSNYIEGKEDASTGGAQT